jgi:hypothetical protein
VLLREDGIFVAAFSVREAMREDLVEAAWEDYDSLISQSA